MAGLLANTLKLHMQPFLQTPHVINLEISDGNSDTIYDVTGQGEVRES